MPWIEFPVTIEYFPDNVLPHEMEEARKLGKTRTVESTITLRLESITAVVPVMSTKTDELTISSIVCAGIPYHVSMPRSEVIKVIKKAETTWQKMMTIRKEN